ncbi:MAG: transposase, partial [Candidatus Delongbacteria bacterium]|nr:transposase [Candidatus Delongbacteria bacterium]
MVLYKNKYRIESARLRSWNYSNIGCYFITICTRNNKDYFGDIKNDILDKSYIGDIVEKYWHDILNHFENIDLDKFIVMPNHIHGIIIINSVETSIYRV